MQELEFSLCERFQGFNLFNLDETDVETLIPFIQYVSLRNSNGKTRNGNMKYKDGKTYKKTTAKASWVNSIF
jgi:Zn-finger nucleic acid-binding protein